MAVSSETEWKAHYFQAKDEVALLTHECERWKLMYFKEKQRRRNISRLFINSMTCDSPIPRKAALSEPQHTSIDTLTDNAISPKSLGVLLSPTLSSFDFDADEEESEEDTANESKKYENSAMKTQSIDPMSMDRISLDSDSELDRCNSIKLQRFPATKACVPIRQTSRTKRASTFSTLDSLGASKTHELLYRMTLKTDIWSSRHLPAHRSIFYSMRAKTDAIYEQILVTGPDSISDSDSNYRKPRVLSEFPLLHQTSYRASIADFCFPNGVPVLYCDEDQARKRMGRTISDFSLASEATTQTNGYTFRLTGGKGEVLYGFCISVFQSLRRMENHLLSELQPLEECVLMAPICYCLISKYPFYKLHFTILRLLVEKEMKDSVSDSLLSSIASCHVRKGGHGWIVTENSVEHLTTEHFYVKNMCQSEREMANERSQALSLSTLDFLQKLRTLKVTEPGAWSKVELNNWTLEYQFPNLVPERWSGCVIVKIMDPTVLVQILGALLLEKQIVIMGQDMASVSAICTALILLLTPFQWQSTFVPILPFHLLEFLHSPVPYVVGCQYIENTSEWPDVWFYDTKQNVLHIPPSISETQRSPKCIPNGLELVTCFTNFRDQLRPIKSEFTKPWFELTEEEESVTHDLIMESRRLVGGIFADFESLFASHDLGPYAYDQLQKELWKIVQNTNFPEFLEEFSQTQMFCQHCEIYRTAPCAYVGPTVAPSCLLPGDSTSSNTNRHSNPHLRVHLRIQNLIQSAGPMSSEETVRCNSSTPTCNYDHKETKNSLPAKKLGNLRVCRANPTTKSSLPPSRIWHVAVYHLANFMNHRSTFHSKFKLVNQERYSLFRFFSSRPTSTLSTKIIDSNTSTCSWASRRSVPSRPKSTEARGTVSDRSKGSATARFESPKINRDQYESWTFRKLRPGLSIRITRARVIKPSLANALIEYTIHVTDLHTKVFWNVPTFYRDIAALREKIRKMHRQSKLDDPAHHVKNLLEIPFPRRTFRVSNNARALEKRRNELEYFLRSVSALEPTCELHIAVLQLLHNALCSPEFVHSLAQIDTKEEPIVPKWIKYCLFTKLNNNALTEGKTCQTLLQTFRHRVHSLMDAAQDNLKEKAEEILRDIRSSLTTLEAYVLDHLDPQFMMELTKEQVQVHVGQDAVEDLDQHVLTKVQELVYLVCEDTILGPLESQIAYLLEHTVDHEKERQVAVNIKKLQDKTQHEIGIPDHLQSDDDWGKSCHYLSMMDERLLAAVKIQDLLASALEVFTSCGEKYRKWCGSSALTADEYLPIHIYVVVHGGLKQPWRLKEYLGAMIHPSKMLGEVGYFLTMFEVALNYIADL